MKRTLLLLALLPPAPLAGQTPTIEDYDYENLWFGGVGFDFGRMWADKVTPANVYTLRLDLGLLGPAVRVSPGVSFWNSQLKDSEMDRLVEQLNQLPGGGGFQRDQFGDISWSDVSLFVDIQVVWRTPVGIGGYIGGSGALHTLNGRGAAIRDTFIEDLLDTITPGIGGFLGVELEPARRFRVYAEGRYTLLSDINYGGLHAGAAFLLPRPVAR